MGNGHHMEYEEHDLIRDT